MGKKGDKLTSDSTIAAEILLDNINSIDGITSKKMFGGYGVFHDGKMFGLVDSKGNIFIKADDSTKSDFEEKGSTKHSRMPYYSIPPNVLEDKDVLIVWVKSAIKISK